MFIRKFKEFYYHLSQGTKNVINYFPVIWNNVEWDYITIFQLLHRKFELMEKLHRENGCAVNSEKYADQIKIAKLLCKRIINDKYKDNALNPVKQKYGEVKHWFENSKTPGYRLFKSEYKSKQHKKDRMRAIARSHEMKKQDIKYLMTFVGKHCQSWWD